MQSIDDINRNLIETNVRMIGNKTTIGEVVQLLAYIRHAVKNNINTTINVKIGNNVVNSEFLFDVNGLEVPDLKTKSEYEIN